MLYLQLSCLLVFPHCIPHVAFGFLYFILIFLTVAVFTVQLVAFCTVVDAEINRPKQIASTVG